MNFTCFLFVDIKNESRLIYPHFSIQSNYSINYTYKRKVEF